MVAGSFKNSHRGSIEDIIHDEAGELHQLSIEASPYRNVEIQQEVSEQDMQLFSERTEVQPFDAALFVARETPNYDVVSGHDLEVEDITGGSYKPLK